MSITRLLTLGVCWFVFAGEVRAQYFNQPAHIRSYFQTFLKREATQTDLDYWRREIRGGVAPLEVQARMLASDEYFQRFGNNPALVVVGMYQDMLGRTPTQNEVAVWLNNWNQARGDRIEFARQFVGSAQAELSTRPGVPPQAVDLATRLTAASELLTQAIQVELMGTHQGRHLLARSNALVSASQEFRQYYTPPRYSPRTWQALADIETSYQAVQQSLSGLQYVGPHSTQHLSQVGELLRVIRASVPAAPPISPPALGIDPGTANRLNTLAFALSRSSQGFAMTVQRAAIGDPNLIPLLRDANYFSAQVDGFRPNVNIGAPLQDLQASFASLRDLANGLAYQMRRADEPIYVTNAAAAALNDLHALGDELGVAIGPGLDLSAPVLVNPPTFGPPNWNWNAGANFTPPPASVAAADGAIARVDAFLAGFQPYLLYSPSAPQLLAQARSLRGALAQYRADATAGRPRSSQAQSVVEIDNQWNATIALWNQTVDGRLPSAPNLVGVATAVQQVNQLFQAGN